jgi:hypothetical protein
MALEEYPKPLHEAYALFQALRKLGFATEELSVGFDYVVGVGHDMLYVQLRTQGKTFVAGAGALPGVSKAQALEGWDDYCKEAGEATEVVLKRVLDETSMRHRHALGFLVARLKKQGIVVKSMQN